MFPNIGLASAAVRSGEFANIDSALVATRKDKDVATGVFVHIGNFLQDFPRLRAIYWDADNCVSIIMRMGGRNAECWCLDCREHKQCDCTTEENSCWLLLSI